MRAQRIRRAGTGRTVLATTATVVASFAAASPVGLAEGGFPPSSSLSRAAPSTAAVQAWGDNSAGELGNATLAASTTPVATTGLGAVSAIAAGGRHDLAVLSDGTVAAWGDDTFGQLGNGVASANGSAETPASVEGLTGVVAVAAGNEHSLALLSNGTVMAWGDNNDGQLGDGTTRDSAVPVLVNGLTGVKAISAGGLFSLALLQNGTVMAWGYNDVGQLGDGSQVNSDLPVAVSSLADVTAISAGYEHALAVLGTGKAMSWGDNESDQLGDGRGVRQPSSDVPVKVVHLSGVTAVAAGGEHSIALLKGGTVEAWGDNGFFELARPDGFPGGIGASDVPLKVEGLGKATAIAAGGLFSLAVTNGGTVQGWGDNAFGQLGNASTATIETPVTVSGLSGVTAVAAGGVDSLAVTAGAGGSVAPGSAAAPGPSSSVWRVQNTPDPSMPGGDGSLDDGLASVSASSTTDAWAVGDSLDSLNPFPLAEHWNGTSWKAAAVPLPAGSSGAVLDGVDDISPSNAWAVGTLDGDQTLIEHWTGTAWAVVPSTNPETGVGTTDDLEAIAGAGADDLWAVGSFGSSDEDFNAVLLEHWNGTSWTFFAPPVKGEQFGRAVTAVASNDVWVVGEQGGGPSTLSLHWNGTAWSEVPTPQLNDGEEPGNLLTGVTATGPDNVWASGYEFNVDQENLSDPYLLHWIGKAWALVKVPDLGSEGSQLFAVTALSATDVWAGGVTFETDAGALTLAEHFDGTSWSAQPSLDPGQLFANPENRFSGIASLQPHTLFGVGSQSSPNKCCLFTLAEHTNDGYRVHD
jgi:alpha-tubulin suppressor-like RCC1 family protein